MGQDVILGERSRDATDTSPVTHPNKTCDRCHRLGAFKLRQASLEKRSAKLTCPKKSKSALTALSYHSCITVGIAEDS